ncbi:sensor histidine kinase [Actinosynnema sp. NPDC053489]|uniref:sensor histidine kinase n=1 Tax=Actinosynnema sp. NPDC053489 TaxID=3363916 RepID=UPI0037C76782
MRNGTVLAVIALAGLVNGMASDALPAWRQLLYPVLAVSAYLVGRWLPVRRGGLVVGAVAAAGVVVGAVRVWEGVGAVASLGLCVVLPWLAGLFRRQQAELIARLEQARELVADRARLRERARIAADVHDSLGHELALIALRAGALELTADAEPTRRAAAGLRESAVTATDRLRRAVGVLREGATAVEPPDEGVEALVARAVGAGLPVTFSRTGDGAALPPLVARAAHRVVQEALTNAARHAPGAPVAVDLAVTAAEARITVTNPTTPPGRTSNPDPTGRRDRADQPAARPGGDATGRVGQVPENGGSGLVGLAERVRLVGGTLRSGVVDGRFVVTARLPREDG